VIAAAILPSARGAALAWVVFVAALAVRAAWVLYRWGQNGATFEFDDEHLHWQLATNLLERGVLVSDDGRYAARMPLYPLFLCPFAWLGSSGILAARLAQAVLGAATALLAYRFAHATLGRKPALVAGLLVGCDPYAVFFTNLLLTEVLFTLVAVALTASAWRAGTPAPGTQRVGVAGVALLGAAAVLTRPSSLGWVAALWLVLWLADRDRIRATRRVALFAGVLAALLLPWGWRNRAPLGSFAWLSTNGGVTLYDAQGPQADGSSNQSFLKIMPELAGLNEVQRDQELRRLALEQMKRDPVRVLRLAGVKFLRTWNFVPNVQEYRHGAAALASALFTSAVLLLAGIGLWRRRAPGLAANATNRVGTAASGRLLYPLLWLPVVYFTLVHCVYVGSLRYRVPLMPFLELLAASAFVSTRSSAVSQRDTAASRA